MAVAKRTGPDFLFIANANSQKFGDIKTSSNVTINFQDSSNADWVSVTGETVTTGNDDPRIKDVYRKTVQAWFGNLGDGIHTGGPEDPRIALIEVQAKCMHQPSPSQISRYSANKPTDISYWKHEVLGGIGIAKEALGAVASGGVAMPGVLRQLTTREITDMRSKHGNMSW
jgi:hypothetical protein